MDYKYIEELIERYWKCETSPEEEQILRFFFNQKDVPVHLLRYKDFFSYIKEEKEIKLNKDFDRKILSKIERPVVKAHKVSLYKRLYPMFKAAAVIAVVIVLGNAVESSFKSKEKITEPQPAENYTETYSNPEEAYDKVSSALKILSETLKKTNLSDSDSIGSWKQLKEKE